ncbi:YwaF family protein [Anaerococcus sp. NML200537]|uniref:YwaF family protein n=1 Tax=Anaerococcus sp. NML200537 TaxID=2954485 RepID=UPI00223851A3|nr:YwaF family protein [Anaerococcus sp. NML200537]MCW6702179.1 YwaF family protein [Anaerococcus sp. NML200537]
MQYFFRHTTDGTFAFNMTYVRLGLILFLLIVYKLKDKKKLLESLLVTSLILQGVLFAWYAMDFDLLIKEGLPLYHCRLAGIMVAISYFLRKEKIQSYFADLALIGTSIAFSIPDPSKFAWPHVTNLTYVANHYVLMACGMLICLKNKQKLGFKEIFLTTAVINSIILILDLSLNANYGYLVKVPIEYFNGLSPIIISLAMTGLMSGAIYLVEIIKEKIRNKKGRKN